MVILSVVLPLLCSTPHQPLSRERQNGKDLVRIMANTVSSDPLRRRFRYGRLYGRLFRAL